MMIKEYLKHLPENGKEPEPRNGDKRKKGPSEEVGFI
jgi:hypothetical protein